MLNLKIQDKDYQIRGIVNDNDFTWKEWSIDQAIKLNEVALSAPKKLLDIYAQMTKEEAEREEIGITDKERLKTFPKFYGDVIHACSNIPKSVIKMMPEPYRKNLYDKYCLWFVFRVLYIDSFIKELDSKSFDFEGETYYLPEKKEVLDSFIPNYESSAVEFQQSSDVMIALEDVKAGKIKGIKYLIAILCRPKGEPYDEGRIVERAEKFGKLDMEIGLGVFFYLVSFIGLYLATSLYSTQDQTSKQRKQRKRQGFLRSIGKALSMKW